MFYFRFLFTIPSLILYTWQKCQTTHRGQPVNSHELSIWSHDLQVSSQLLNEVLSKCPLDGLTASTPTFSVSCGIEAKSLGLQLFPRVTGTLTHPSRISLSILYWLVHIDPSGIKFSDQNANISQRKKIAQLQICLSKYSNTQILWHIDHTRQYRFGHGEWHTGTSTYGALWTYSCVNSKTEDIQFVCACCISKGVCLTRSDCCIACYKLVQLIKKRIFTLSGASV